MSSSDTTPVHTTSQEKEEAQALDLPDTCTELEVIRSAGRGPERSWGPGVQPVYSQHQLFVQGRLGHPLRAVAHLPGNPSHL